MSQGSIRQFWWGGRTCGPLGVFWELNEATQIGCIVLQIGSFGCIVLQIGSIENFLVPCCLMHSTELNTLPVA